MNTTNNIQNKICSLNIDINDKIVNNIPILFRIYEHSDKSINDIILEHIDDILNIVYDKCCTIDDMLNPKLHIIVYDTLSEEDKYNTYNIDIANYVSYDNGKVHELINDKINEYSKFILKEIKIDETPESFVDTFNIINKHNDKPISPITFTQYILSCFNKEYAGNKNLNNITNVANEIMKSKIN